MRLLTRIEAIKDMVQEAIEQGSQHVEQIHQNLAAMPFDMLEQRGLLSERAKQIRDTQEAVIGTVYGAIRKVNHEAGDLASSLIETLDDQITTQKNIGKK